jgi:hypothetical protein
MIQTAGLLLAALSLLAGSAAPLVAAPAHTRYSGTVAMIDPQGGVMAIDEIGPWRVEQGQTVVTSRTITLTAETRINTFIRVSAPGAFTGDFIEVEFEPTDVWPGDFVTVDCRRARGRLIALTVTVAELN